jgi:paraquat-inducible protein A
MSEASTGPLAHRAAGIDRVLGVALLISLAMLVAGLLLPAITIRSFWFARDYSLLDSVLAFLEAGDWFLFLITALFSILFPLGKIVTALALWYALDASRPVAHRALVWLGTLSKWSMLDVFIIALVILVADGRLLSSADIGIGAIVFSLAVLLSTWAVRRLARLAENPQQAG